MMFVSYLLTATLIVSLEFRYFLSPAYLTVMTAVPFALAVIKPFSSTLTTLGLLLS